MQIALLCGYFSLMGYLLRCFLKRCANMTESKEELSVMRGTSQNEMILIWEETKVFNFYCSLILPLVFMFVYAKNFLHHTFVHDPDHVKMIDLVRDYMGH